MMLLLRTRYLWFVIVSVIYVLLVFVLHRNLHHLNVPDMSDDAADVEGGQRIIDDNRLGLAFPVVRHCVGQSGEPPSPLVPLGSDWLYTAYFDDRLKLSLNSSHNVVYIRVLALLRRRRAADFNRRPTFYFRWLQSETGNTTTTVAETYEMCENHGRRYGGWILSTKFTGRLPPCSVVVTQNLSSDDQVRLPVFRTNIDEPLTVEEEKDSWMSGVSLLRELTRAKAADIQKKKRPGNFAVCVPPLYGTLMPATLVQFVELTRLLGAEHFVFYVGSVSETVRQVLDAYEADDVLTTIPWVLPAAAAHSVWNNAQLLAVNDCLYRTSHAFQHVAFNDVDEFIVPHSAMNWSLMLAELTAGVDGRPRRRRSDRQRTSRLQRTSRQIRRNVDALMRSPATAKNLSASESEQSNICGYTFRSAFFQSVPSSFRRHRASTSAYSNASAVFDEPSSYDVTTVHRSAFSRVRTKVIVRPRAVFELGIHHISRPLYSLPVAATATRGTRATHGVGPAPTEVVAVGPEVGFVHHYRACTNDYEYDLDCNWSSFVVDERLLTAGYIPTLRSRVHTRLEAIRKLRGRKLRSVDHRAIGA